MPIMVQNNFPLKKCLEENDVFVMDERRAKHQDIRPVEVAVLNFSPLNKELELDLWRSLSNSPLQVHITSLLFECEEESCAKEGLESFYMKFSAVRMRFFDGLVITGISDGTGSLAFEARKDWHQICEVLEWSAAHVTSTLFLGDAAEMALYHFYGAARVKLSGDLFGVYPQKVTDRSVPLVRGFDDVFYSPLVRTSGFEEEPLRRNEDLRVLAESDETGIYLLVNSFGHWIFCLGHPESGRAFLDGEYRKRMEKGYPTSVPKNYYPNDDEKETPLLQWRGHGNSLFSNWLNYYVYQNTPFEFNQISLD